MLWLLFGEVYNFKESWLLFYIEHSKEALELSKLQESTKQSEQMAKIKEYEAAIEQAKVEQKRIDYEERRKTLQVCSCYLFDFVICY